MLLLFILITITNGKILPKYYDLVLQRCSQNSTKWDGNCHGLPWTIFGIFSMQDWGVSIPNYWYNDTYNGTVLSHIKPIESELDKYWFGCGECGGNCSFVNPAAWWGVWNNYGICSNWSILEYFKNGLVMFNIASRFNFYNCCHNQIQYCHLPYNKDLMSLGCYWPGGNELH